METGSPQEQSQQPSGYDSGTNLTVVGIGASAGGLSALKQLFEQLGPDTGLAFVVVVHLSPEHKSHLADLLQPSVRFPVRQVTETTLLEPNNVYVIPPNANLSAIDTHLRLSKLEQQRRERAPIDHFFRTLALTHDGHSIGVILTGTGSDGTLGLKEIKAKGGLILVQDPNDAEFDGMPQSAIATGIVDRVLPLAELPEALLRLSKGAPRLTSAGEDQEPELSGRILLPKVLAILKARTDRDFSRYKPATLLRRIGRRMQLNYIDEVEQYLEFMRSQPDEARTLADDLLITVTSFFRDSAVFQKLETDLVPHLFEGKGPDDTVRIWSVGCATGEEAYSVAMLLLEEASRREAPPKVQIFASDLHKRSLDSAREGLYPGDITTDVSPARLKRFFQKANGGYRICKEVRDLVVFAPHNLLGDPPFSRLDLITCRNLLIYLERSVQRDVISLFHYALCPQGYLLLGSAETIDASELFRPEDKKLCLYRKRNVQAPEPRLPVFPLTRLRVTAEPPSKSENVTHAVPYQALHQTLLEQNTPPSVLVSPDNQLVHVAGAAGRYLIHPEGELTASALRLVREELRIELQALLQLAREKKAPLDSRPIAVRFNGHETPVVMHVRTARNPEQDGFVLVIFEEYPARPDNTGDSELGSAGFLSEPGQETARITELEEELQVARQGLQATIEEYETSREEMKAANEEMQSTNEELRSTLEELETSKEELQSINEELQTVNQENRHKVEELSQLSGDLQNLLSATDIATLFLDRELRIMRFTPRLEELFNVRVTDRGRPISDLTHRLGYGQLREDAEAVLSRLVPVEREIRDDRGRWYLTNVLPYRSTDDRIEGVVITFIDITSRKTGEAALRESEEKYRTLFETMAQGYALCEVVRDEGGRAIDCRYIDLNPAFERLIGVPISTARGRTAREIIPGLEDIWIETCDRVVRQRQRERVEYEVGSLGRWYEVYFYPAGGDRYVGLYEEITNRKRAEDRQVFLLKLSDALRPLSDPVAIQETAMRVLGAHMKANRAFYGEALDDQDTLLIGPGYSHELFALEGQVKFSEFDWDMLAAYRGGATVVIDDVHRDSRFSEKSQAAFDVIHVQAAVGVPLVKEGRIRAIVSLHQSSPRKWTAAEIALLEETAERTWAAVERARAEAALRDSEARYQALFAASPVPFMVLAPNPPDFTILAANEAYFAATLTTRETLIGRRLFDVFTDDPTRPGQLGSDALNISLARVLRTRKTDAMERVRYDIVTPSGGFEAHWWLAINAPLLDAAGNVTAIIHQVDRQTELHYAEEALQESETRLRQFGEASQDVLWIRDANTLQWTYLTPAFETIYGLDRAEALSGNNYRSWLDLIVPEDRQRAEDSVRRVWAGEHVTFDYRVKRPRDGNIRWLRNTDFPIVDEHGKVTLIGGIGHDLTELREAQLRLQTLIEGMPQLVWRAVDGGDWTWASPQWIEYTGLSDSESRGRGWLEALHPDDRVASQEAWADAMETGGFEVKCRLCRADGREWRWFQTRATPVRDEAGMIIEWLGTSTDIHDLRELQERQKVLVAELQHRTRNLMGVVRSVADKTARSSADLHDFRTRFRDRLDALARVQGLLSRLNEHDRVTFEELIRTELSALDGNAEQVDLDGPVGIRLRSSTVQTLALALHELATNAVKYGALRQPSGRLAVRWSLQPAGSEGQPWLHIDWRETGVVIPSTPDSQPERRGQGRELIERALPYQLKARTHYALEPDGVHCTISVPISATNSSSEVASA